VDKIGYAAKAIAGFIVGVVSALVTRFASGELTVPSIDPFDVKGWVTIVALGILGYLGVFIPANKLSPKQVSKGIDGLPEDARERVLSRYRDAA